MHEDLNQFYSLSLNIYARGHELPSKFGIEDLGTLDPPGPADETNDRREVVV